MLNADLVRAALWYAFAAVWFCGWSGAALTLLLWQCLQRRK